MPISIICDLEQHKFSTSIRVHDLSMSHERVLEARTWLAYREGDSSHKGTEKASPHCFDAEVACHFLKR